MCLSNLRRTISLGAFPGRNPGKTTSRWTSLVRSEEHTSELQSRSDLVCRLLLEKKNDRLLHASCSRQPHPHVAGGSPRGVAVSSRGELSRHSLGHVRPGGTSVRQTAQGDRR